MDGFYSKGKFSADIQRAVKTIESIHKIQRCFKAEEGAISDINECCRQISLEWEQE